MATAISHQEALIMHSHNWFRTMINFFLPIAAVLHRDQAKVQDPKECHKLPTMTYQDTTCWDCDYFTTTITEQDFLDSGKALRTIILPSPHSECQRSGNFFVAEPLTTVQPTQRSLPARSRPRTLSSSSTISRASPSPDLNCSPSVSRYFRSMFGRRSRISTTRNLIATQLQEPSKGLWKKLAKVFIGALISDHGDITIGMDAMILFPDHMGE